MSSNKLRISFYLFKNQANNLDINETAFLILYRIIIRTIISENKRDWTLPQINDACIVISLIPRFSTSFKIIVNVRV